MATQDCLGNRQDSGVPDKPHFPLESDTNDSANLGEAPLSPTADSRGAAELRLPQSLDKLPLIERKYPVDAGIEINRHDVEHLCKVWAEVGRAVLLRRRAIS